MATCKCCKHTQKIGTTKGFVVQLFDSSKLVKAESCEKCKHIALYS